MLPTTKCHWIKPTPYIGYKTLLAIIFFMTLSIIGSLLYNADAEVEVTFQPTTACIITHQTLNRNESQELCGKIVSTQ